MITIQRFTDAYIALRSQHYMELVLSSNGPFNVACDARGLYEEDIAAPILERFEPTVPETAVDPAERPQLRSAGETSLALGVTPHAVLICAAHVGQLAFTKQIVRDFEARHSMNQRLYPR